MESRRVLQIGGIVSGGVLVLFGIAVIVLAARGHSTVTDELTKQHITGSPDMTPAAIEAEAAKAGLKDVSLPTCDVAGKPIDSGDRARCFAQYMNVHALEATGGYTYAEMGIYTAKPDAPAAKVEPGGGTNDVEAAATDPKTGKPAQNGTRQVWVTETALATALNMSYMATQLSLFSLVVGVALILAGIGFLVLALGGALKGVGGGQPAEPAVATS